MRCGHKKIKCCIFTSISWQQKHLQDITFQMNCHNQEARLQNYLHMGQQEDWAWLDQIVKVTSRIAVSEEVVSVLTDCMYQRTGCLIWMGPDDGGQCLRIYQIFICFIYKKTNFLLLGIVYSRIFSLEICKQVHCIVLKTWTWKNLSRPTVIVTAPSPSHNRAFAPLGHNAVSAARPFFALFKNML